MGEVVEEKKAPKRRPPSMRELMATNPLVLDSNSSVSSECSEVAREEFALHLLDKESARESRLESRGSVGSSGPNRLTRKRSKVKKWSEKYEPITVVLSPVLSRDVFKELTDKIRSDCGDFKSTYLREDEGCGFVYFHHPEECEQCKAKFDGLAFQGTTLRATSPAQFYVNKEDILISSKGGKSDEPASASLAPPDANQKQAGANDRALQRESNGDMDRDEGDGGKAKGEGRSRVGSKALPDANEYSSPQRRKSVGLLPTPPADQRRPMSSPPSLPLPPPAILPNPVPLNKNAPVYVPPPLLEEKASTSLLLHASGVTHQKMVDLVARLEHPPKEASYECDDEGNFQGRVMVVFEQVKDAVKAMQALQHAKIGGHALTVSFVDTSPPSSPSRSPPPRSRSPPALSHTPPTPPTPVPQQKVPAPPPMPHPMVAAGPPSGPFRVAPAFSVAIRDGLEFEAVQTALVARPRDLPPQPPPPGALGNSAVAMPLLREGLEFDGF